MRYGQTRCVKSHRAHVVQIRTPKLLEDNTSVQERQTRARFTAAPGRWHGRRLRNLYDEHG